MLLLQLAVDTQQEPPLHKALPGKAESIKGSYNFVWALLRKASPNSSVRVIGYLWYATLDIMRAMVVLSMSMGYEKDVGTIGDILFAYSLIYCPIGNVDVINPESANRGEILLEEYREKMPTKVMELLDRGFFRLKQALSGAIGDSEKVTKWSNEKGVRIKDKGRHGATDTRKAGVHHQDQQHKLELQQ